MITPTIAPPLNSSYRLSTFSSASRVRDRQSTKFLNHFETAIDLETFDGLKIETVLESSKLLKTLERHYFVASLSFTW